MLITGIVLPRTVKTLPSESLLSLYEEWDSILSKMSEDNIWLCTSILIITLQIVRKHVPAENLLSHDAVNVDAAIQRLGRLSSVRIFNGLISGVFFPSPLQDAHQTKTAYARNDSRISPKMHLFT